MINKEFWQKVAGNWMVESPGEALEEPLDDIDQDSVPCIKINVTMDVDTSEHPGITLQLHTDTSELDRQIEKLEVGQISDDDVLDILDDLDDAE